MKNKIRVIAVVLLVLMLACLLCGCKKKKTKVNPCTHSKTHVETIDPTCTEAGSKKTVCDLCGAVVSTETLAAINHSFGGWKTVVLPTESEMGLAKRVCSNNTVHVETRVIPKLEEGTVYSLQTTPADCKTAGVKVYTSATYGEFSVVIPKTQHDYDNAVNTSEGLFCPNCKEKLSSLNLKFDLSEDESYYIVSRERGHAENSGLNYNDADLVIPAYYNGKPVKEIANDAFYACGWITSITIPETIETIGLGVFNMAEATNGRLKTINFNAKRCNDLPGKNWAFSPTLSGNDADITVNFGSEVERVPARLFFPLVTDPSRTVTVAHVNFAANSALTEIGEYAFYKTKIDQASIPATVRTIGQYAFYGTNLTSIELPDTVSTLGQCTFGACVELETATFGASLTEIPDDCFNYCKNLSAVDLSVTAVKSLGVDAFRYCEKLTSVTLPDVLENIYDNAFAGCKLLESCAVGNCLKTIGQGAFQDCESLQEITIPKTVQSIGNCAFENCKKLALINFCAKNCSDFQAGNRTFAFAGAETTLEVIFSADVLNIPAMLFYSSAESDANVTIAQLQLHSNLQSVGDNAFWGATITACTYLGLAKHWEAVQVGVGNVALQEVVASYFVEVAK